MNSRVKRVINKKKKKRQDLLIPCLSKVFRAVLCKPFCKKKKRHIQLFMLKPRLFFQIYLSTVSFHHFYVTTAAHIPGGERKTAQEQLSYKPRGKKTPNSKKDLNLFKETNQNKPSWPKAHLLQHHQKWKFLQLFVK